MNQGIGRRSHLCIEKSLVRLFEWLTADLTRFDVPRLLGSDGMRIVEKSAATVNERNMMSGHRGPRFASWRRGLA
jgi:hypothetical protein